MGGGGSNGYLCTLLLTSLAEHDPAQDVGRTLEGLQITSHLVTDFPLLPVNL